MSTKSALREEQSRRTDLSMPTLAMGAGDTPQPASHKERTAMMAATVPAVVMITPVTLTLGAVIQRISTDTALGTTKLYCGPRVPSATPVYRTHGGRASQPYLNAPVPKTPQKNRPSPYLSPCQGPPLPLPTFFPPRPSLGSGLVQGLWSNSLVVTGGPPATTDLVPAPSASSRTTARGLAVLVARDFHAIYLL